MVVVKINDDSTNIGTMHNVMSSIAFYVLLAMKQ